jgi:GDPmannose 4,6-dehydratase
MTKEVNCLISGVTGMVGSHLVDFLIENTNWNIYGICRWRSPIENIESHINLINNGDRFSLHYCDLRDLEALQNIFTKFKFDYVFHLAAQSYPQTSFISPTDTYETNIIGTHNILNCIKSFSPQAVVHVCSSSEVFGRVSKEEVPISETCRFHPASPYAISKCGTDLIGQYFAEAYKLNIQITRMFTHTGPRRGDVFMESSFAKQIALLENGFIEGPLKVGNLDSLRTIADVRDAVRAYYLLVTVEPVPGGIYNIGGTHTMTVREILEYLISISKLKNIRYEVDPSRLRPIDADLQVPDMSKFQKKTGWIPLISYEKTLTDLLDFWRNKVIKNNGKFLVR